MKIVNQIEPFINSQELHEVKKCIRSGFLTENKLTEKFERIFAKYTESRYAVAVSNWTSGLFMCLKVFNIGKNDEVIVPNLTFIATINSVILSGAKPVLCEVSDKNMCIDVDRIERLINKKTKAIIPVHLYGNCCNMNKLLKLSKKYNLRIIEDAAQSLGSKYSNRFLGTIGDIGGFSLFANKPITTGEGGIILTNNKSIRDKLYQLKNYGREKRGVFLHSTIGYNFKFTDMQAALGIAQMKKLNYALKRKKEIFNFYKKKLSALPEIFFIEVDDQLKIVHWFINIFTEKKDELKKFLEKKKIMTRDVFLPMNKQPCFDKNNFVIGSNKKYPISLSFFKTGLSLPSSINLNKKVLDYICNNIRLFYDQNRNRYNKSRP